MASEVLDYFYIPELDKDGSRARLALMTDTSSRGGLSSSAQMQFAEQTGSNFTFEMCGDFRKIVLTTRTLRGTQKNLDAHHKAAFTPESSEALKAETIAFYVAKEAARR
jgi:hypothetical protein